MDLGLSHPQPCGPGVGSLVTPYGSGPGLCSKSDPFCSIEEQMARHALATINLSGVMLIESITARVATLQLEDQKAFVTILTVLMSSLVLGMPTIAETRTP